MVHFIWHVMTERLFSLPLTKFGIHFGHVRMCATPCSISLIIFILDLGPSYTDKICWNSDGYKLRTSRSFLFWMVTFLVVLLMVFTFRNLLGLLESSIMLQTSTLEINV